MTCEWKDNFVQLNNYNHFLNNYLGNKYYRNFLFLTYPFESVPVYSCSVGQCCLIEFVYYLFAIHWQHPQNLHHMAIHCKVKMFDFWFHCHLLKEQQQSQNNIPSLRQTMTWWWLCWFSWFNNEMDGEDNSNKNKNKNNINVEHKQFKPNNFTVETWKSGK